MQILPVPSAVVKGGSPRKGEWTTRYAWVIICDKPRGTERIF